MYQWPIVKILYSKYLLAKNFYHTMPLYDPCSIPKGERIKERVIITLSPNDHSNEVLNYLNPNTSKS